MLTYTIHFIGRTISAPPSVYYPLMHLNGKPMSLEWHKAAGIEMRHSYATKQEAEVAAFNALLYIAANLPENA